MKLIDEWRKCYKFVSVQAMVLAGAIQGAWVYIPDSLRASVPQNIVTGVTVALLVLGVVGRVIDQGKKDADA